MFYSLAMLMWILPLIFVLHRYAVEGSTFSPDTTDFDAYGIKIAANDVLFVEAEGGTEKFLVQFAPYNYTLEPLQCSFDYDDTTHYVYSVGVGIKQNSSSNVYFYFAGEVVSQGFITTDSTGHNGTYIGVWINQDPQSVQSYINTNQPLQCNHFQTGSMKFISTYGHQEFFIIAVEPYGTYAIGLASDFGFIYTPFPISTITTKSASNIWPSSSTFRPCAADASQLFTIVAGFLDSSARSRVRATPTVYLMWNSNLTVLASWSYTATNNSWKSRLTYASVDTWNSKYTMSVKINSNDPTRVLVGMPFLNTVFLFVVTNGGTNLTLASSIDNGQSVGFGKSVTWLTGSQAAFLVATYSLDYSTLYSSQIYVYTSLNATSLPSSPTAVIPNSQQSLPSTISSQLIRAVSTSAALAILDVNGVVLLLLATSPGYYASTDMSNSPVAAAMPVVSYSATCIGGTYKTDTGIHPCILCLNGSYNPGGAPGAACMICSSNSFCPVGAAYDIESAALVSQSQAYAYPRSPDMNVYEDILLANMFSIGSTSHCVRVSPLFWTLIVMLLAIIIVLGMASLNWFVRPPKGDQWRHKIKQIFRRTDLVGEGELWVGGLASVAIIVMTVMAYVFAISYLWHYPAETVGSFSFACDTTLRNAQYQSSLQALAVPVSDDEQPIFTLLNDQNFTLHIDLINTAASCFESSVAEVVGSSTVTLPITSCTSSNGTLSVALFLPDHDCTIVATLGAVQLVGGVSVGLSGSESGNGSYALQELNFWEVFYSQSGGTLTQTASITMELTKVINETKPLADGSSNFAGIWYPTFTVNLNQMFITADNYVKSANLTSSTLTIVIAETSYYIYNIQSPIAKQSEILFRTLLFSFLCLEISALGFLLCKLFLIPLYEKSIIFCLRSRNNRTESTTELELSHE